MIADQELADAVKDLANWQAGDDAALYAPPEATVIVRIQRVRQPTKRERYMAAVIRDGRATYTMPFAAVTGDARP